MLYSHPVMVRKICITLIELTEKGSSHLIHFSELAP